MSSTDDVPAGLPVDLPVLITLYIPELSVTVGAGNSNGWW